ncbi:MAG: hypothetical protein RLZ33_2806 [Bacteroidota bacterium]|jgi:hypothetical protein
MKKVLFVAALGMLTLASCKKDYTCECTINGLTSTSTMKDVKKKDAEKSCDALNANAAILSGSCKLK